MNNNLTEAWAVGLTVYDPVYYDRSEIKGVLWFRDELTARYAAHLALYSQRAERVYIKLLPFRPLTEYPEKPILVDIELKHIDDTEGINLLVRPIINYFGRGYSGSFTHLGFDYHSWKLKKSI